MTNNFMIAYQGSEGSYSEELLKKEFSNYSFIACESFTELLNKVSSCLLYTSDAADTSRV